LTAAVGLAHGAGPSSSGGAAPPDVVRSRIDDYFQRSAGTYKVNGVEVKVLPFFRLGWGKPPDGMHVPSSVKQSQVLAALGPRAAALQQAVHQCVWGRPTPEELAKVTQALIDAGKLDEVRKKFDAMSPADFRRQHGSVPLPLSDAHAIQMLQWEYGLGMDCAGYVQQAFLDVHGGTRDTYKFQDIGNEVLYWLKGNPSFDRELTPVHAQPGDLIIMKPPKGDFAGHTVLVRDRHELTSAESGSLTNLGAFRQPGDLVHRIEVHASWGAGQGNLDRGGVQSRVFLYNETSGKWADIEAGAVKPQSVGPYGGHPVEGVYHPNR